MQLSMELMLAIYGALISTALAVLTFVKFLREKPRISVEATPIFTPAAGDDETHGVLVRTRRGDDILWEEADIEIRVRNAGAQACQITDVFVETATTSQQVTPIGLPVVLEPKTSCSVRVQPEYFAPKAPAEEGGMKEVTVEAVGVFDALGKKHPIPNKNLVTLVRFCSELPLRTARYKHKETGNIVVAFQVKDTATIVLKK
jgi:hypothetical protein